MKHPIRRTLLAASGAAWLALTPAAFAAGAYHPENSEAGATFFPEHAAAKSRSEVSAELARAMQHPAWLPAISRGAPWPVPASGVGLTRAQVNAELQAAMRHPAWNSVSRGAPWPVEAPIKAGAQSATR